MKRKTILLPLAIAVSLVSAISVFTSQFTPKSVSADDFLYKGTEINADEQELTSNELSFRLSVSTTTDISQHYKLSFATAYNGYSDSKMITYLSIDDPKFDPDLTFEYYGENFSGFLSLVNKKEGLQKLIIPETVVYSVFFTIHNYTISEGVVNGDSESGNLANTVTEIIIPKTITTIHKNAFKNIPSTVTIHCEASSKPEGWAEGWTDATNITWGYVPSEEEKSQMSLTSLSPEEIKTGNKFYLGHTGEGLKTTEDLYTYIQYDVYKNDVKKETKIERIPINNASGNPYYAVGIGTQTTDLEYNISKASDEYIKDDSIIIHNIHGVKEDGTPDESKAYYIKPQNTVKSKTDLSTIFTYGTSRESSFLNHIQTNINVDLKENAYQTLNPTSYEKYKSKLKKGEVFMRYRFTNMKGANYYVTYQEGNEVKSKSFYVDAPVGYIMLDKPTGNSVGFIINCGANGLPSFGSIKSIELQNFAVEVAVILKDSSKYADSSSFVLLSFGSIALYNSQTAFGPYYDIEALCLIVTGAYVALYIVGAFALYFYLKNKYKNDEFKRVNKKRYTIKAIKNFVGWGIVTVAIEMIIYRTAIMNTGVVLSNPIDPFLIAFSVGAIIFLGFSIKNLIVYIRTVKQNKEKQRLKLDKDVAEDGTN